MAAPTAYRDLLTKNKNKRFLPMSQLCVKMLVGEYLSTQSWRGSDVLCSNLKNKWTTLDHYYTDVYALIVQLLLEFLSLYMDIVNCRCFLLFLWTTFLFALVDASWIIMISSFLALSIRVVVWRLLYYLCWKSFKGFLLKFT